MTKFSGMDYFKALEVYNRKSEVWKATGATQIDLRDGGMPLDLEVEHGIEKDTQFLIDAGRKESLIYFYINNEYRQKDQAFSVDLEEGPIAHTYRGLQMSALGLTAQQCGAVENLTEAVLRYKHGQVSSALGLPESMLGKRTKVTISRPGIQFDPWDRIEPSTQKDKIEMTLKEVQRYSNDRTLEFYELMAEEGFTMRTIPVGKKSKHYPAFVSYVVKVGGNDHGLHDELAHYIRNGSGVQHLQSTINTELGYGKGAVALDSDPAMAFNRAIKLLCKEREAYGLSLGGEKS